MSVRQLGACLPGPPLFICGFFHAFFHAQAQKCPRVLMRPQWMASSLDAKRLGKRTSRCDSVPVGLLVLTTNLVFNDKPPLNSE